MEAALAGKSKQIPRDLRRFARECLRQCLSCKLALLNGLRETQRDPTLNKVALYVVDLCLTRMAKDLSTLGWSALARKVLLIRDRCTEDSAIGDALVVIDMAMRAVGALAQMPPEAIKPKTLQSLAYTRAHLIVLSCCDESNRRLFTEKDVPKLIKKQPEVLDRLYTAAARLNQLRLPGVKRADDPTGQNPVVHPDTFKISIGEKECRFSSRQQLLFRLLERLLNAPGRSISFDNLCREGDVWSGRVVSDTTIKGAVSRLRKHLRKSEFDDVAAGISTLLIENRGHVRYDPATAEPQITPNSD